MWTKDKKEENMVSMGIEPMTLACHQFIFELLLAPRSTN